MSRVLDMGRGSLHLLKPGVSFRAWNELQDTLLLHPFKPGASFRVWNATQDALN